MLQCHSSSGGSVQSSVDGLVRRAAVWLADWLRSVLRGILFKFHRVPLQRQVALARLQAGKGPGRAAAQVVLVQQRSASDGRGVVAYATPNFTGPPLHCMPHTCASSRGHWSRMRPSRTTSDASTRMRPMTLGLACGAEVVPVGRGVGQLCPHPSSTWPQTLAASVGMRNITALLNDHQPFMPQQRTFCRKGTLREARASMVPGCSYTTTDSEEAAARGRGGSCAVMQWGRGRCDGLGRPGAAGPAAGETSACTQCATCARCTSQQCAAPLVFQPCKSSSSGAHPRR